MASELGPSSTENRRTQSSDYFQTRVLKSKLNSIETCEAKIRLEQSTGNPVLSKGNKNSGQQSLSSKDGLRTRRSYFNVPRVEDSLTRGPVRANPKVEAVKLALIFDNLSYRTLGFGFPLLTIGILSGAVWANEAWGSYWSWDPKETWAFITWIIFAIYFHTRLTQGWRGEKSALVASAGFIIVWICYLGVNLIGKGLHSYGFIQ